VRCAGADADGLVALPAAARALSAGSAFACALLEGGSLWCWGRNSEGQLGRGALSPREGPARVALDGVTAIVAGARHACATAGGATWCWGDRAAGQLGDGVTGAAMATPARVDAWRANPLAAGAGFTCALQGAAVSCAGANDAGQLGDGTTVSRALPDRPVAGFVRTSLTAVAAGARHACAIVVDESVWCWGDGADGQLGDGALAARPLLTRVRW
jgi:alpha-tubulin suppressor-like RCC1 family protein